MVFHSYIEWYSDDTFLKANQEVSIAMVPSAKSLSDIELDFGSLQQTQVYDICELCSARFF